MRRFAAAVAIYVLVPLLALAAEDRMPTAKKAHVAPMSSVKRVVAPSIDRKKVDAEDQKRATKKLPPRFAVAHRVNITPDTDGTWERVDPKTLLWRLRINTPGAVSQNLGFTRFHLPKGARLSIYSTDYKSIVRPFTAKDEKRSGQLWTPIVPGDDLIVELTVPESQKHAVDLQLGSINRGYRQLGEPSGPLGAPSLPCEIDVACPQADPWRDQVRSAAMYTADGVLGCSGSLVNNTAGDLTPYFLTAGHCLGPDPASVLASIVVYWNFESSTCRPSGSDENVTGGDGSLDDFQSGASLVASLPIYEGDFALFRLDDFPDPSFDVFWAGWDNRAVEAQSGAGIHQPGLNEKRINILNHPTTQSTLIPDDPSLMEVTWDEGINEYGSSGSPLFNQDHRVVGNMSVFDGGLECGVVQHDDYARVSSSWNGGGSSSTRLSDWLDPSGANASTVDGTDVYPTFVLTASPQSHALCAPAVSTYDIDPVSVLGYSDSVALTVSGLPQGASASLTPSTVATGSSSVLAIQTASIPAGEYSLDVTGAGGSFVRKVQVGLEVFIADPSVPDLLSPPDGTDQKPALVFAWSESAGVASYLLEIATDEAFGNVVLSARVPATSQFVTGLEPGTDYFWRVQAENPCGTMASRVSKFRTVSGTILPLGDEDAIEVPLGFSFPFQGREWTSVWVNSNGNLTFGTGDPQTYRSTLDGPPRIAPFLADLNPTFTGAVTVDEQPGSLTVHWVSVPLFTSDETSSFSVTLDRKGGVKMEWGAVSKLAIDPLVGVVEGNGAPDPGPTDLSALKHGRTAGTQYEIFPSDSESGVNAFDLSSRSLVFKRSEKGQNGVHGNFVQAPAIVEGAGATSSVSYAVDFAYSGPFRARSWGLVPASEEVATVEDDPGNNFDAALSSEVGIHAHTVEIPAGTVLARFALFDDATDGNHDLDLYVLGPDGWFSWSDQFFTSDEQVTRSSPTPGTYTVYVHGYETDGPTATYTLFSWLPGITDVGGMSVVAPKSAKRGTTGTVTASWAGLDSPHGYLGFITYHSQPNPKDFFDQQVGMTVVAVKP